MITHLLCVDPAQRYTINEFLNHPWCTASAAPPPPPTPGPNYRDMPLDSPLLVDMHGGLAREARSPGVATLKEAFDITYAVHRMEEEGARRRAARGVANRGFLGGLNEEDEDSSLDEDEHIVMEAKQRHGTIGRADERSSRSTQPPVVAVGAGARVAAKRAVNGAPQSKAYSSKTHATRKHGSVPFELDLDNATLLGRRHKRGGDASPLVQKGPFGQQTLPDNPGSPMRVD